MLRNPSPAEATYAPASYSEEAAARIYSRILRVCLKAGIGRAESEDIAQDIWTWLLRSGSPSLALTAPWLSAVAQNYVLRFRRRAGWLQAREGVAIDAIPEPGSSGDTRRLEAREVLDRMAAVLPRTERELLALIREGHTVANAARLLGIPRGSRAFYRARLVRAARGEMQARVGGAAFPR
ncbi:MAG TPA: sigma-70 family RNA polymerase sigma factor [Thermoanaerobaculia bacterium]